MTSWGFSPCLNIIFRFRSCFEEMGKCDPADSAIAMFELQLFYSVHTRLLSPTNIKHHHHSHHHPQRHYHHHYYLLSFLFSILPPFPLLLSLLASHLL